MKLLDILEAVLSGAEHIVPIFVKNPNSQKIEAVVFGAAEEAIAAHQALAEKRASAKEGSSVNVSAQ